MVKPKTEYIYLPIIQQGVHKPFKFIFIKEVVIDDKPMITFRYIKKNTWNAYSIMTYLKTDIFFNEKDCWVECNRLNMAKRDKYMQIASTYLEKAHKYGEAILVGKCIGTKGWKEVKHGSHK